MRLIVGRQIGRIGGWQALFDAGGDAWNEHIMACRFAPGVLDARAADWYRVQQGATRAGPAMAIAELLASIDQRAALPGLKPPLMVLLPGDSPFVSTAMYADLPTWGCQVRDPAWVSRCAARIAVSSARPPMRAAARQDFIASQGPA